jgi:hypothetical protein
MEPKLYLTIFLIVGGLFGQTNAQSPRDELQQLTAQLQQSPGDQALREKIIALALTINPKPATPDAAIMAEAAAEYAFKNAKANSDFSDAAKQYEKALLLAPWSPQIISTAVWRMKKPARTRRPSSASTFSCWPRRMRTMP